jgi:hypothetical protein
MRSIEDSNTSRFSASRVADVATKADAVNRVLGQHIGEFAHCGIGAFQRLVGEAVGFVHILPEPNHPEHAGHDVMRAISIDARDFETNRVRAAIDARDRHCIPL